MYCKNSNILLRFPELILFLSPRVSSQQPTLSSPIKLAAITHILFFKLHEKWRHVGESLLDQFPQKKQMYTSMEPQYMSHILAYSMNSDCKGGENPLILWIAEQHICKQLVVHVISLFFSSITWCDQGLSVSKLRLEQNKYFSKNLKPLHRGKNSLRCSINF